MVSMEKQFQKIPINSIEMAPKGGMYITKNQRQIFLLKKLLFVFVLTTAIIRLFRKKS